MSTLEELVICPYNRNHVLRKYKVQYHIPICKEKYQDVLSITCRFSCRGLSQEDPEFIGEPVPVVFGSKSKRRRVKIRERRALRIQRPRKNEPPKHYGIYGKPAKMNIQPEVVTPYILKKTVSPKKNLFLASRNKAQHSTENANQPSKSAKRRYQKKQRKLRGAAKAKANAKKDVPGGESDEKEEYVIKLNESVSVTETDRSRQEVFIHYPTKKQVLEDSLPKTAFGIQPLMLQRICFEAFMRMHYPPDGERSEMPPSSKESKSKQNQVSNETANVAIPPVIENEDKTTQTVDEIASGRAPAVIKKQKKPTRFVKETASVGISSVTGNRDKTTQTVDETASGRAPIKKQKKATKTTNAKSNAASQNPKRSKSRKNKKKPNTKTGPSINAAEALLLEELQLRNRFAKYMISDSDDFPPPPPRPDPQSFPPPYLEFKENEESEGSEDLDSSAEQDNEDSEDYKYSSDDEQANKIDESEKRNDGDGNRNGKH